MKTGTKLLLIVFAVIALKALTVVVLAKPFLCKEFF